MHNILIRHRFQESPQQREIKRSTGATNLIMSRPTILQVCQFKVGEE
jgi:hypothetical protein